MLDGHACLRRNNEVPAHLSEEECYIGPCSPLRGGMLRVKAHH
jgi:hypothetical protein